MTASASPETAADAIRATSPEAPHPPQGKRSGAPADVLHPQKIRTFVKRAGRTSSGQARAIQNLGAEFMVPYSPAPVTWPALWGADWQGQPVVLEIGFGMGDATAHIAQARPDTVFLGCEVHEPGVGALLKLIGERGLRNLRIVSHDAVEVLEHMIPPASLDGVHIFFPDPWHKSRHHKRRLIQAPLVQLLCSRLKPGGYVHCATDWAPYAEQILSVLSAEPALRNQSSHADGYADRPSYRPVTKFERRGLRLGHGVWDLVFEKI